MRIGFGAVCGVSIRWGVLDCIPCGEGVTTEYQNTNLNKVGAMCQMIILNDSNLRQEGLSFSAGWKTGGEKRGKD